MQTNRGITPEIPLNCAIIIYNLTEVPQGAGAKLYERLT